MIELHYEDYINDIEFDMPVIYNDDMGDDCWGYKTVYTAYEPMVEEDEFWEYY